MLGTSSDAFSSSYKPVSLLYTAYFTVSTSYSFAVSFVPSVNTVPSVNVTDVTPTVGIVSSAYVNVSPFVIPFTTTVAPVIPFPTIVKLTSFSTIAA